MNWIDIILLILLVAAIIVGSKKGLIREIMALAVLTATVIVSVNYIDIIATKIYEVLGGSPLVTAIISFVLLLAIIYAVFKLLGIMFYRVANLQKLGKKDQLGGAFVGAVRGWVIISFVVFVVFLMPMPERFYDDFGESFLGPTFAKTLPLLYESTSGLHPENNNFMEKVERTLLLRPSPGMSESQQFRLSEDREQVYRVIYQIDRFFGTADANI
ncbi:MAG: CvpA family protein [Candidatus Zixiibacteriota bacterium]|nr:MAG: CvpA family protein [candidate division Zixibacteria bacterium]